MTSTAQEHPLDNVMWTALTTLHANFSRGGELARRYHPEFARFCGVPALNDATLRALAADLAPDEIVALVVDHDFDPAPMFEVVDRKNLVQMIGAVSGQARAPERFRVLGPADMAQMTALVELTEPGPWYPRTPELGRFLGFDADGRIVAMAGERMRVPGYTEISGVCCHPQWRGRGLPTDLMRLLSQGIVARGETPFLHVIAENASAIALYEKQGLRKRQQNRLAVLRRAAASLYAGIQAPSTLRQAQP